MTIRKPPIELLFVAASILLSSVAQLTMKIGMQDMPLQLLHTWPTMDVVMNSLLYPALFVAFGLGCYFVSLLFWLAALARHDLSFIYPFLGLTHVLVYLGAVFLPALHESVSIYKTAGIALIICGVALVAKSHRQSE